MSAEHVLRIMQEAILLALLLAAPAVIAALAVGLVAGVIQTATQIHENAATVAPKLVAVVAVLGLAGLWMLGELVRFAASVYQQIAAVH